ncbi:unnamed protein product [Camellia sinensis]
MVIEKQILRYPKSTVSEDNSESNHKSRDEYRSNAGEEDDDDARQDEDAKGFSVGEGAAEEDERGIGGAEEVEEEPGGEEGQEQEESEGVGEERDGEDDGEGNEVVDAEVGVVFADAERGFGDGVGL